MKLKRNALIEKTTNILLNILLFIFGVALLISIYTGVQKKVLGNDYTNFFGYSVFEVQTGSMAETINPGDWILVQLTQNVKLNDVVTYQSGGEYITHRVVEAYKGTFVTKGDANNAKDEPIDKNQIVGKVISIWSRFGIIKKTLFNLPVLITLIITMFLFNMAFSKNKKDNMFDAMIKKFIHKFKGSKPKPEKPVQSPQVDDKPSINIEKIEPDENLSTKTSPDGHYVDNSDLEKTIFYRVVPVDADDVHDKYKQEAPTIKQVDEYYKDSSDLEKTSLYRMVPVDANEVDDTLLEIAENQIKASAASDKQKKDGTEEDTKTKEDVENENLTAINLKMLKNAKGRIGKNVIDTAMNIKKEELNELIKVIVTSDEKHVDRETVKDELVEAYIHAKYYNFYEDKIIEYTGKGTAKLEKVINAAKEKLIKNYKGNDTKYKITVENYANALVLITNLEHANESIHDSRAKIGFYENLINEKFINFNSRNSNQMIDVQKKYSDMLKYFLKDLETYLFNVVLHKIASKKDLYGVELEHNLSFSKVYSEYIIDKTFTNGIVAEDKLVVLFSLLSLQLIKDMIASDFNKKYIIYIPVSMYEKDKKLTHALGMIDDSYAKENVFILVSIDDLLINQKIMKNIRKMGYKFALAFDKELTIPEKDRGNIYIADYIFINKKAVDVKKILPNIPEELLDNVIYDNIADKVGDFGGEQA